jgi:hypothetical protein
MNTQTIDLQQTTEQIQNTMVAGGLIILAFYLVVMGLVLANFVLTIITLVKAIKSTSPDKTMWVLVIILVPLIGWILYRVLTREPAYTPQAAATTPRPPQPPALRTTPPVVLHPVCRPAQTAAVADSVQTAMDEMIRKRRAARSTRS